MNKQELLEQLKAEMQSVKVGIIDRAHELPTITEDELLDINMKHEDFALYDTNEMENHNYDLGQYMAYKHIIEKIENESSNNN